MRPHLARRCAESWFVKSLFFFFCARPRGRYNAINWPTGRGITYLFVHRMTNAANLTAKARPAFLAGEILGKSLYRSPRFPDEGNRRNVTTYLPIIRARAHSNRNGISIAILIADPAAVSIFPCNLVINSIVEKCFRELRGARFRTLTFPVKYKFVK